MFRYWLQSHEKHSPNIIHHPIAVWWDLTYEKIGSRDGACEDPCWRRNSSTSIEGHSRILGSWFQINSAVFIISIIIMLFIISIITSNGGHIRELCLCLKPGPMLPFHIHQRRAPIISFSWIPSLPALRVIGRSRSWFAELDWIVGLQNYTELKGELHKIPTK